MLETQKFIQEKGWNALKDELGISIRDYPEQQLKLLDYSQIDSPKNHPVVLECRGLILDYNVNVVCKSFNRFFNLGENGVNDFDFKNSICYEKADGSLVRIYWCRNTNRWEIATRGTAFAEGPHHMGGTFRDWILKAIGKTEEEFQEDCNKNGYIGIYETQIFEYCGPENRIVTRYDIPHLVFLGLNLNALNEYLQPNLDTVNQFKSIGWNVRMPKEYRFDSLEACLEVLKELPDLQEGYVVYNTQTGERVKMKSPAYVVAHRIRGNGLTMNSICELVAMNEQDEYLTYFPEDRKFFTPVEDKLSEIILNIKGTYVLYRDVESQKDFALAIKDHPFSGVMFKARKMNISVIDAWNDYPVSKRAEWLKEQMEK